MSEDIFVQAIEKIIHEQEGVIGPLAVEQARKVPGLQIEGNKITLNGDQTKILGDLVKQYQSLFGQTSVEVCKEAIATILPRFQSQQVPSLLQ